MRSLIALTLMATLSFASAATADTEAGMQDFDLTLEDVNLDSDLNDSDFDFIFDAEKDSPEVLEAMISEEKAAWDDHVANMDKWNEWDYSQRHSYRHGFRHSYYSGYRYANRYNYSYSYNNRYTDHRNAYRYSYWRSANYHCRTTARRNYNDRAYRSAYRNAYHRGYRHGYRHGRFDRY